MSSKQLYRSEKDKKITGLCGGLAEYFNVDATILRLITVAAAVFSGGAIIILYILGALVVPKEPSFIDRNVHTGNAYGSNTASQNSFQSYHAGPGPGYQTGSTSNTGSVYRSKFDTEAPSAGKESDLDEMMKEVEKKAMQKEIEELRAKLAQYENQQKNNKGE